MHLVEQETPIETEIRHFGPARVLESDERTGRARVLVDGRNGAVECQARSVMQGMRRIVPGEMVLVLGTNAETLYIIGVLDARHRSQSEIGPALEDGTHARVTGGGTEERLQVISGKGDLLFEYEAGSRRTRVNICSGDLEFIAARGNLSFVSEGDIRFSSARSVEMESVREIRLSAAVAMGKGRSSIRMGERRLSLTGEEVGVTARTADFRIQRSRLSGSEFSACLSRASVVLGRLETVVNVAIARAKNVYNAVEGLIQTRAERMRTLVDASFHLKAERTVLKADQDFKIKGEQIHLG